MEDLFNITDYVIESLKKAEFIIQRYNSVTSNSIYLTLDFGVCNSIRISDHKGKKNQFFRYNVIMGFKGIHCSRLPNGLQGYYYGFDNVDIMLKKIIALRETKISRLGLSGYMQLLDECMQEALRLSRGEDRWEIL